MYEKRSGDKTDGCATFFKESKFTLVKSKLVSFNKPEVKLMDRDNVAVVVLLKPRTTGSSSRHANMVCVSNTHLLFNKKRGDIKLAQLSCLFSEIEEIARISPPGTRGSSYHPVICCGDFNSTPFSPIIYSFVVQGFLDYKGMNRDNFSGQSHFRHSYPPKYGITSNLIPWELGITTSCVKRIDSSESNGNSCSSAVRQDNLQASGCRTLPVSSCSERPVNSAVQFETSKGNSSNCRNAEHRVGNNDSLEPSGGHTSSPTHCHPEQSKELQSPQRRTATTQSQSLNSIEHGEGGETGKHSVKDVTEKDAYNACTIQRHKFDFFSVYRHYRDGSQKVTTFHDQSSTTVDYIFVSPGQQQYCRRCKKKHGPLQLTGNLNLLSESDIWYLDGQALPNKFLSSDHLSLVASFLLHV